MSNKKFGLGRGLNALIPDTASARPDVVSGGPLSGPLAQPLQAAMPGDGAQGSNIYLVPIEAISPNSQQPRAPIDEDEELHDLAASIREYGLLQPLLVSFDGEDNHGPRYQIIAGERRWRAAQLAGLATAPVIIRDATPREMLEMALVENLQRSDLNALETAQGYRSLIDEYGMTQEQVAERVGRNRVTIANTLRLLQLPAEVLEALTRMPDVFTEGHARAVLMVNRDADRIALKNQIVAQKLSVRQAEEMARRYNEASLQLSPDRRGGAVRPQSMETRVLEEEFTRAIEMKARLQRTTKGKGSLTLFFTNEAQLQALYERIVGAQAGRATTGGFGVFGEPDATGYLNGPFGGGDDRDR